LRGKKPIPKERGRMPRITLWEKRKKKRNLALWGCLGWRKLWRGGAREASEGKREKIPPQKEKVLEKKELGLSSGGEEKELPKPGGKTSGKKKERGRDTTFSKKDLGGGEGDMGNVGKKVIMIGKKRGNLRGGW